MLKEAHRRVSTAIALSSQDLAQLCALDEAIMGKLLREHVSQSLGNGAQAFAVLADEAGLQWQHAAEEFDAALLQKARRPDVKGALARFWTGSVWCVWCRYFKPDGRVELHVLRFVIDHDGVDSDIGHSRPAYQSTAVGAAEAVLLAAVREAREWGAGEVLIRNPAEIVVQAARRLSPGTVAEEEVKGLPMFHWKDDHEGLRDVEWLCAEEFIDF
jgi:hypothetical protein